MTTGTETTTDFLHSLRTSTRFGSILKTSATRRSCSWASSKGFSRRWETGASTVVTESLLVASVQGKSGRSLADGEGDRPRARRPRARRIRGQEQPVAAVLEGVSLRVAAGQSERV